MLFRYLLCLLGLLLALPVLPLIAMTFVLPTTVSGIGYLLGCFLVVLGLILVPQPGKYPLLLILTGVTLIALVAGIRLAGIKQNQSANLEVVTLPRGTQMRWLNSLIDEQDALIFGEAIFHRLGGDSPREHAQMAATLKADYSEMRKAQRIFASPVISTYLGLQQASSFDAVVVKPQNVSHPETALIFLHGYMGNVTAQCWEIAQAVREFGFTTVCPSSDWTGQWWQPEGKAILQATFRYLRGQGVQKFYVGGFSNGGFGVSRLVSELRKEDGLSGLIFIDGIYDGVSIRETGLPVLIIQGAQDERVSAKEVRQIVGVLGALGTYVELPSDHFVIMKQPKHVQDAIKHWLETLVGNH